MIEVLLDFLIPFATIFLAELGDKTQVAMMAFAARYRHALAIFFGAMSASAIVDGSAVFIGRYVSDFLPRFWVSVAAGVLFVIFGIYSLARKEESGKVKLAARKSVFIAAFMLFFVSEFGDKSQFAALLFGAKYNLALAVLGTLSAIASVLVVMLVAGNYVRKLFSERAIRLASSALFISIGALILLQALF